MKTIATVIRAGSIEAGHAIQVDLAFADQSRESLRCESHNIANLIRALMQAAAVAEAQRTAQPRQPLALEMPHRATDVQVGTGADGSIAMRFPTHAGVPVVVAMSADLAQTTIERLGEVLKTLGSTPPSGKH